MSTSMLQPALLQGARVLITGGGSGLGLAMAHGLAALGAQVYICGRRQAVLDAAAAAINAKQGAGRCTGWACNLRDPAAIDALLTRIWADGGPLTGLVNNAAASFISRTETVSAKGYDTITETVARGSFLMTTGCGRRWIEQQHTGAVVSILSSWVWSGGPFATPLAMAKASLQVMTQSLAVEWAKHHIRLNGVCPGLFPTEGMTQSLAPADMGVLNLSGGPMGRTGRPQELVDLVAFLLAPGSGYISGQTLAIDGASHLAGSATLAHLSQWTDAQWQTARQATRAAPLPAAS